MTETSQSIPTELGDPLTRNPQRFSTLSPDPRAVIPEGTSGTLGVLSSYELVRGRDRESPSADPYSPKNLTEVCIDAWTPWNRSGAASIHDVTANQRAIDNGRCEDDN